MIIEFYRNDVILNGRKYKVLVPLQKYDKLSIMTMDEEDPKQVYLTSTGIWNCYKLAEIFYFSSKNKDTIVYIPCKNNSMCKEIEKENESFDDYWNYNDLVLVHQSFQLKPKYWKDIKQKLKNIDITKCEIPDTELKKIDQQRNEKDDFHNKYGKLFYKENKDFLCVKRKSSSVIFVGSEIIFEHIAETFNEYGKFTDYNSQYFSDEIGITKQGIKIRVKIISHIKISEYIRNYYDNYGNIRKKEEISEEGKIIDYTEYKYEYGENGKILKETILDRYNREINYYEYNEFGQKIRFIWWEYDMYSFNLLKKRESIYDDLGNSIVKGYDSEENEVSCL